MRRLNVTGGRVAAAAGQGGEAVDAARLAHIHRTLLADRDIQFDLPTFVMPKPPAWLKPLADFLHAIAPAAPYVFWGVIGIGVAILLYFVLTNLVGVELPWRRRQAVGATETQWVPEATAARALLTEAEALAAEGRYAEAARLLLRRSVEDIARRLPQFLKPSLTARDIATAPALPGAARPAFAAIAHVVEVSAFGSRSVSADAWGECRAAYARFALPESWRG